MQEVEKVSRIDFLNELKESGVLRELYKIGYLSSNAFTELPIYEEYKKKLDTGLYFKYEIESILKKKHGISNRTIQAIAQKLSKNTCL